jgi:dTDP-L-rhamnose 4-epimerase
LTDRGDQVHVVDILQPRVHPNGWPKEMSEVCESMIRADVTGTNTWYDLLDWGPDAILHLAAYQDYMPDYSTFFDVNATGTSMLYEIANEVGWRGQVVVASSQATLGEGAYTCRGCGMRFIGGNRSEKDVAHGYYEMPCPTCGSFKTSAVWTHEHEVWPKTPYGVSKLTEELIATRVGQMLGIPSVGMRYAIVQGAGQSPYNAYSGVLRATALQILAYENDSSREVILFEDGEQLRDFVSIDSVVDANIIALDGKLKPYEGYNVGSATSYAIIDMARTLCEIQAVDPNVVTAPGFARVGDVRNTLSDVNKLVRESQGEWEPIRSLTTTWARYMSWLEEQDLDPGVIVDGAFENMKKNGVLIEVSK